MCFAKIQLLSRDVVSYRLCTVRDFLWRIFHLKQIHKKNCLAILVWISYNNPC